MSEQHLEARRITGDLRRWGGEVRYAQQEAMTMPLIDLADRIDDFVEKYPEQVNEIAGARPVDKVPYALHDLPPNLFDHCRTGPFIPDSDHELERFMDSFWPSHMKLHASIPGIHMHATQPSFREGLTQTLRERREQGLDIDPDLWDQYQTSYHAQLDRGFYTLGHNAAIMNMRGISELMRDSGVFEFAAGRQDAYHYTHIDSPHTQGFYVRVPEGAYGQSERLLRTASFIADFMNQDREFNAELWHNVGQHYDIIENHTVKGTAFRKLTGGVTFSNEESTVVSSQDGGNSILGAIGMLTAEPIKGYENDFETVCKKLNEADMINQLTLQLPLGIVGGSATYGFYFPGLVEVNSDGELQFGVKAREQLNEIRKREAITIHGWWQEYHESVRRIGEAATNEKAPMVQTGLPCPFAGAYKKPDGEVISGAVSRHSQTFFRVLDCVTEQPKDASHSVLPWDVPRILPEQR